MNGDNGDEKQKFALRLNRHKKEYSILFNMIQMI